jgi:outer membrane protein OmpA-like peptidoglycan-associated protein
MTLLRLLLLSALIACSVASHAEGNRPATPADLARIQQLQRHVDRLSFGPLGPNNYTLCKARAWLDMALIEYHENELTGIVQDSMAQADLLLQRLDADPGYLGLDTPIPYASEKVRPDLWSVVDDLKKQGIAACTGCKLAKLEVQLVWTGHDKWEAGWGHAEPFARIAENLAYEVQVDAAKCNAKNECASITKYTLATELLFDFDVSLMKEGKQKLEGIAEQLKKWKKVDSIQITGHSDKLNETGDGLYNMKLSQLRADFVRIFLVNHGVSADKIKVAAMGDTQPLVNCTKQRAKKDRLALIACLQPNRRVEIVVEGERR